MAIFITVVTEFHEIGRTSDNDPIWEDSDKIIGVSSLKEVAFSNGKPNDFFQVEEWEIGADKPTTIYRYQNEHVVGLDGWFETVIK